MKLATTAALFLALAIVLPSCARPPEAPAPAPSPGVENAALDIGLATVPEGLRVVVNEGRSLQLEPVDATAGGHISFEVGPEEIGVNLVAAVRDHQQYIEGLPDGEYQGAQELQADFGTAFYSRGRYTDDGAALEETVIFRIHPRASRLLSISSRYPAGGDSAARVEQLIEVLSNVE